MAKWQLGDSGVFSLTGCQIGACYQPSHPRAPGRVGRPRLEKSPSLAFKKRRARAEIEKSVIEQWRPIEIPQVVADDVPSTAPFALPAQDGEEEEEEEEENLERLLDWRREPDEKDKPKSQMTVTSSRQISARMRWQVAFAKVREKTATARRNQHRIALTNKVKEYLMYTNSRGSCSKLRRCLDSYERSNFVEREEITYEAFTDGLLDEAETWVSQSFEDMQSALEPVVLSEPSRKYDMNEFDRMMRMNEQENEWLDAQRRKTDDLMDVHVRLMSRSAASMAESVAKGKQVLTSLVNEIAEGMHRHNNLVHEHEATEAELFELARKQKLLLTSIQEFEERKKEATDGYARELESLKTEHGKLKRAVETARSALVKDKDRFSHLWKILRDRLKSQMSEQMSVLGQVHVLRIRRQGEVHERQRIMRLASLEKDIQEMRRRLQARQKYLKELKVKQELQDLRQEVYEAKLLLFEVRARADEVTETGEPAVKEELRKMFQTGDRSLLKRGFISFLAEQLQIQRQWLLDRGQRFSLNARKLLPRGKNVLSTPTSLLQLAYHVMQQRELDAAEMSREKLTNVFRSELTRQRTEVLSLVMDMQQSQLNVSGLLASDDDVHVALEDSIRSLEATRKSQESLMESWAQLANHSENASAAWVNSELEEKLEDLQKGLSLAETSTRWLQAPAQNSSLVLADVTSREEMRWLTDLTQTLGERCGRLRAGAALMEEAAQSDGLEGVYNAVGSLLLGLPSVVDEELVTVSKKWTKRVQLNLEKRKKLHGEVASAYRRLSVHQGGQSVESVFEGVDSLKVMLEDPQLTETGAQDDMTPAELLSILHSTAARVFQQSDSYKWALVGLGGLDTMASEAVAQEQALRALNSPRGAKVTSRDDTVSFSKTNLLDGLEIQEDLTLQGTGLDDEDIPAEPIHEELPVQTVHQVLADPGHPLEVIQGQEGHNFQSMVHEMDITAEHGREEHSAQTAQQVLAGADQSLDRAHGQEGQTLRGTVLQRGIPAEPRQPSREEQPAQTVQQGPVREVGLPTVPGREEQPAQMVQQVLPGPSQPTEVVQVKAGRTLQGTLSEADIHAGPGGQEHPAQMVQDAKKVHAGPDQSAEVQGQVGQTLQGTVREARIPAEPQTPSSEEPTALMAQQVLAGAGYPLEVVQGQAGQSLQGNVHQGGIPAEPLQNGHEEPQALTVHQAGQTLQGTVHQGGIPAEPHRPGRQEHPAQTAQQAVLAGPDHDLDALQAGQTLQGTVHQGGIPAEPHRPGRKEDAVQAAQQVAMAGPGHPLEAVQSQAGQIPQGTAGEADIRAKPHHEEHPAQTAQQVLGGHAHLLEEGQNLQGKVHQMGISVEPGREEHPAQTVQQVQAGHSHPSEVVQGKVAVPTTKVQPPTIPAEASANPSRATSDAPAVETEAQAESTDTLADWVTANISRRLSAAEPSSAVHGEVIQGPVRVAETETSRRLSAVRTGLGLGSTGSPAPGLLPGKKKKARRPKALTRLGRDHDDDEPAASPSPEEQGELQEGPVEVAEIQPLALPSAHASQPVFSKPAKASSSPGIQLRPKTHGTEVARAADSKAKDATSEPAEDEAEAPEEEVEPRAYSRPKRVDPHNVAARLMTGRSQNEDDLEKMAIADMAGDMAAVAAYAQSALDQFQGASESEESGSPSSPRSPQRLPQRLQQRAPQGGLPGAMQSRLPMPSDELLEMPVPAPTSESRATEESKLDREAVVLDASATSSRNTWTGKTLTGHLQKRPSAVHLELDGELRIGLENDSEQVKTASQSLAKPGRLPRAISQDALEDPQNIEGLSGTVAGTPTPKPTSAALADAVDSPRSWGAELEDMDRLFELMAAGQRPAENIAERIQHAQIQEDEIPAPDWVDSWVSQQDFLADYDDSQWRQGRGGGKRTLSDAGGSSVPHAQQKQQPQLAVYSLTAQGESGHGARAFKGAAKKTKGKPSRSPEKKAPFGADAAFPKAVATPRQPESSREDSKAQPSKPSRPRPAGKAEIASEEQRTPRDANPVDLQGSEEIMQKLLGRRLTEVASPAPPKLKAAEEKPRERKEEVDEPKEVLDVGKEVVEAVAPQGETDNFSLARNTSKTAVSKRYFATTGGKKGLVHSRSFRMQEGDEPKQKQEDQGEDEAAAEEEPAETPAKQRWKLGTLAVQAVVRLRTQIRSPSPTPERRRSSIRAPPVRILYQPDTPPPPESINKPAAPRAPKRKAQAPKNDEALQKRTEDTKRTLHEAPPVAGVSEQSAANKEVPDADEPLHPAMGVAPFSSTDSSLALTAATIQAIRSMNEPDLSHLRKAEARLLSARTQTTGWLSHDSSRITFFSAKTDSATSTVGFSPYASRTDLIKNASGTTLSYQSSAAKLSVASREDEVLVQTKPPASEATGEVSAKASGAAYAGRGALEEELIGNILGGSPEPGEEDSEAMLRYGRILGMRTSPPAAAGSRRSSAKASKAPEQPGALVLAHLAKPSRQPASARGARDPPGALRRRPVYN